jgi:hypothetical protein
MSRFCSMARTAWLAALVATAACGGDGSTGPNNNNNGASRMTATVNGRAFSSNALGGLEKVVMVNRALHLVQGAQTSGTNATVILITLWNLRGPGTYPIGVGPTTVGGTGQVTENGLSWITPLTGTAGEVRITTLTDTRIAGTFTFTAEAVGGSTGTRAVTNGQFDYPIEPMGNVVPIADNAGSRVSGTIAGNAFYGATVTGGLIASNTLIFNASSERGYYISFSLGSVSGPGTYALSTTSPFRYIIAAQAASLTATWGSPATAGSSGSVTITSFTPTRIAGTFTATLAANPGATGTIAVTGSFDIGRI